MRPHPLRFVKKLAVAHFSKERFLLPTVCLLMNATEPALAGEKSLEIRLGYAQFMTKAIQHIYGPGAPDVEIEGHFGLTPHLKLWGNLNCVWQEGTSLGIEDDTEFSMKTLSTGFKMVFFQNMECFHVCLGLGILGTYCYIQDHVAGLKDQQERWGSGAVGKFNINFYLSDCVFLDTFLDYYYQPVNGESSLVVSGDTINMGGFRVGLGLGCAF